MKQNLQHSIFNKLGRVIVDMHKTPTQNLEEQSPSGATAI